MFGFLRSAGEATTTHEAQRSSTLQRLQEKEMDPATCLRFLSEVPAGLLVCSLRDTAGMPHVSAQSPFGRMSGFWVRCPGKCKHTEALKQRPEVDKNAGGYPLHNCPKCADAQSKARVQIRLGRWKCVSCKQKTGRWYALQTCPCSS